MASGWAKDGAVQEQIDQTVSDAVATARAHLGSTASTRTTCVECGETIPDARRQAIPGVQHCVTCQAKLDVAEASIGGANRRASKDALLR